jgi:hypothetical protein
MVEVSHLDEVSHRNSGDGILTTVGARPLPIAVVFAALPEV